MISLMGLRRFDRLLAYIVCTDLTVQNAFVKDIDEELQNPTDKRIFAIAAAFHRGYSVEKIWQMTCIDKWFLTRLQYLSNMERHIS